MAGAAREAGVELVTGDTKVVEHGKGDGIFITTSGVGLVFADPIPDPSTVQPGDLIVISGRSVHGMAVMSVREGLAFESELKSDSAPLGDMVAAVYRAGARPRCLRDPTRGGVAATLTEIAQASRTGIVLRKTPCRFPKSSKAPVRSWALTLFWWQTKGS